MPRPRAQASERRAGVGPTTTRRMAAHLLESLGISWNLSDSLGFYWSPRRSPCAPTEGRHSERTRQVSHANKPPARQQRIVVVARRSLPTAPRCSGAVMRVGLHCTGRHDGEAGGRASPCDGRQVVGRAGERPDRVHQPQELAPLQERRRRRATDKATAVGGLSGGLRSGWADRVLLREARARVSLQLQSRFSTGVAAVSSGGAHLHARGPEPPRPEAAPSSPGPLEAGTGLEPRPRSRPARGARP